MKQLFLFFCSLSFVITTRADPPKEVNLSGGTLTLETVTECVRSGNPSIKAARAKWDAMKLRVPQARAWDDLKISANTRLARFVDVGHNSFTDQMLSVEQMLPIAGKNQSRGRIAAAEALAAFEDLRHIELDEVAKARAAFFRLLKAQAQLELMRANENSLHDTLESSRARFETGGQSQVDVLNAENEIARNTEARRELQQTASFEETQLKVLMNRDPFAPLGKPVDSTPSGAVPVPPVESLRALLLNNRPEIRGARANLAAAQARLELAKREWIPEPAISLEAQRYNGAAQAASEVSAGVSFNVPWLNGAKYRAGERQAASEVEGAQHLLRAAEVEALGLLHDQLEKIGTLHHHLDLFGTQLIPRARLILETNRGNYASSTATLPDLLLAQRNLFDLEAMAQTHQTDYQVALAELEALIGADLHLFSSKTETANRRKK